MHVLHCILDNQTSTFTCIISQKPRSVQVLKPLKFLKHPIHKEILCCISCQTNDNI